MKKILLVAALVLAINSCSLQEEKVTDSNFGVVGKTNSGKIENLKEEAKACLDNFSFELKKEKKSLELPFKKGDKVGLHELEEGGIDIAPYIGGEVWYFEEIYNNFVLLKNNENYSIFVAKNGSFEKIWEAKEITLEQYDELSKDYYKELWGWKFIDNFVDQGGDPFIGDEMNMGGFFGQEVLNLLFDNTMKQVGSFYYTETQINLEPKNKENPNIEKAYKFISEDSYYQDEKIIEKGFIDGAWTNYPEFDCSDGKYNWMRGFKNDLYTCSVSMKSKDGKKGEFVILCAGVDKYKRH